MAEALNIPRREREKARQRQEMLQAALSLFSEKGYYSVTMQEIAEKAEFAIGTIYKFFKNKEELYKALIQEAAKEFHDSILAALNENEDEVEKLKNFVRAKSEIFRAHIPVIRLYFSESRGESFNAQAGLDAIIRDQRNAFLKALASVFAGGIKKKRFKPIADPYYLAVALDGITTDFLFMWLESPERYPYPKDPDVILDIFYKGLLA